MTEKRMGVGGFSLRQYCRVCGNLLMYTKSEVTADGELWFYACPKATLIYNIHDLAVMEVSAKAPHG